MTIWSKQIGNITIHKPHGGENICGETWDGQKPFPIRLRNNLTMGIRIAPLMLESAKRAITEYSLYLNESGHFNQDRIRAIEEGLDKYFELDYIVQGGMTDQSVLNGILNVYRLVAQGMENGYELQLCVNTADSLRGRVQLDSNINNPGTQPSPIRTLFGFTDEFGHVAWNPTLVNAPIGIGVAWLASAPVKELDETMVGLSVARVLVHEGTHKWATTKDVLYKHQSAAWKANTEEAAVDITSIMKTHNWKKAAGNDKVFDKNLGVHADKTTNNNQRQILRDKMVNLEHYNQIAAQNAVASTHRNKTRPFSGENKPLISMNVRGMGVEINPIRWLENADSYSWFARRMWKLDGSPMQ